MSRRSRAKHTLPDLLYAPPSGPREVSGAVFVPAQLATLAGFAKITNPRDATKIAVVANVAPTTGQVAYENSAVSTTGYTQYHLWNPANAWAWRMQGGEAYVSSDFGGNEKLICTRMGLAPDGNNLFGSGFVSFVTDDPEPLIRTVGGSANFQLRVDGVRLSANVVSSSAGGFQWTKLNLSQLPGGIKLREVQIELRTNIETVAAIAVRPAYTVTAPARGPRLMILTDSLGSSGPDLITLDGMGRTLADLLGVSDTWVYASGGSGYISHSAAIWNGAELVAEAHRVSGGFDAYIVALGINDSQTGSLRNGQVVTIGRAAALTYSAIRSVSPLAPLTVFGPWAGSGPGSGGLSSNQIAKIALEPSILSAVPTDGRSVAIKTMSGLKPWIYGTGNANAPAGDGNADYLFSSADLTHWRRLGHAVMARRMAGEVVSSWLQAK